MSGWPNVRLADVARVGAGNSAPQDKALFEDGVYPFFRTADVGRVKVGELASAQDHLNEQGTRGLKLHRAGTVLIPKSGASTFLDHRVIMAVDGYVSSHLATLWADDAVLDRRYLYWVMQTIAARDVSTDTSYPTLNLNQIGNIEIPLPPREEQRRIVAVLDDAFTAIDAAIGNAEKNVANARELIDAEMRTAFSSSEADWDWLTLSEASLDFGRGKSKHRPRNDPGLYGGPYPFIQTGDVRNSDHLIKEYSQTYSDAGLAQSKLWPRGTICITIAANIAETGILDFDACFPDSVIGMVVDPQRCSQHYVEYLLQSLKAELQAKGKGSAQANINLATFENERFPFPPLARQAEITERLDEVGDCVRELVTLYERKIAAFAELKQSLLHLAFSGEPTAGEPLAA